MSIIEASNSNFNLIPTGEYLAQLTNVEDKEGDFGPQFEISFEIIAPKEFAGLTKLGWCSKKLSSGNKPSKLWGWTQAIYNRAISAGERVDTDDLVGRKVIIVVVSAENKDGEETSKITALKPHKTQQPFPLPLTDVAPVMSDDLTDPFEGQ